MQCGKFVALAAWIGFAPLSATSKQAPMSQADALLVVKKGEALFNDPKLSGAGDLSCAQCHPNNGHTNNKTYVGTEVVADGDPEGRSTPTLWAAGTRSVYAWAGTALSLEENIRGIIINRMKGAEPSPETLAALAAYVRSLPPPRNAGILDDGTPSEAAREAIKRGFSLFVGEGACGSCHVLPTFDKPELEDVGSGGAFKVPALHAVSLTAPYFHDGRYKGLAEAVRYMWEVQAAKAGSPSKPTDAQMSDLLAYLNAL
ncbi:MAG: c-type cytochrome [Rhodospirillaceae bacterium]|nr:c-type cytochrome [Rhodospirillaceae bacterium]